MYNQKPDIQIYKILKKLIKENRIERDCDIQFAGGEPTLHSEFEEIIRLFLDNSFSRVRINSSGIKYSKIIERGLKEDKLLLCISPDSGERELYKKIKRTDCYDILWNNISKYAKARNNNKKSLQLKYVIIPNVNDTESDIQKFLNKVIENNIKFVIIDFEAHSYRTKKYNIQFIKKSFSLVKYAKQYTTKYDVELCYGPSVNSAISEFKELYIAE